MMRFVPRAKGQADAWSTGAKKKAVLPNRALWTSAGRNRLRRIDLTGSGRTGYADSLNDVDTGKRVPLRGRVEVVRVATFGRAIADARRAKELSQKELAALIQKEDGGAISPQYLNDIEHDRRSPTSDSLIRQFAKALGEKEEYLFVLAGKIPDDLRSKAGDRDQIVEGFTNFRRAISKRR
jgi:transcriptional regulator with XRE-family HTH domain